MDENDLVLEVKRTSRAAKTASAKVAQLSDAQRNDCLCSMASALRDDAPEILAANECDIARARTEGMSESLIDRLMLNEARIDDMANSLVSIAALPDPLGIVQEKRKLASGIDLSRVSVPLGVVAIIYEARPNVTVDAAALCLKSGNACVLRGGSAAAHTNKVLIACLASVLKEKGLPKDAICDLETNDRRAADILMQMHDEIDVLIPRGGAGLIKHCVETSRVPVIETGTGNCHVYVHKSADKTIAHDIVMNAKCRRFGVCNAAESLLVDESIASDFLPSLFVDLAKEGVTLHCDELARLCTSRIATECGVSAIAATEADWETEYLAPELAVKCVSGPDEAIAHINRYGTRHSEAIVANPKDDEGARAIEAFCAQVDAAAVYVNASTAFTDGGMFGLGAEIGISTQKLHVRGPFALNALTSYKYILTGTGQVRS
jgi:glutamate-5-semialdehyde dehydrogenase